MNAFARTATTYRQGATTLPREAYVSDELLAREAEHLFRRTWLCAGREDRVAAVGQYLVHDRFGDSFVVVRGRDGVLRAFHNSCRHRGTRLCEGSGSVGATIQCPYHAWTWSTEGTLLGAPHMQEVEGFDRADYPLVQVPVACWEGFVFVSHDEDVIPFGEAWATVHDRFTRFGLSRLVRVDRREYEVRANWKIVMQNYNECLHCPVIHPELNQLLPYLSGENDLHEGPFLGGFMGIMPEREGVTLSGRACGVPLAAGSGADRRRAFYYSFWPNMMLSIHPDYANWYSVWPSAPDRSVVTCEWLVHPATLENPAHTAADAVALWLEVNRQDWAICERSQAGVSIRGYRPGPYSPRESLPAAWDREWTKVMGRD